MEKSNKTIKREVRRLRVRARVKGTAERPRLNVFRSLRGFFVQLINDDTGKTLVSANFKELGKKKISAGERTGKVAVAYALGGLLAKKAKEQGISRAVFDRAGYKYHGRVKAAADGARDNGLEF